MTSMSDIIEQMDVLGMVETHVDSAIENIAEAIRTLKNADKWCASSADVTTTQQDVDRMLSRLVIMRQHLQERIQKLRDSG